MNREKLKKMEQLNNVINEKRDEVFRLYILAEGVTGVSYNERVQTSKSNDKMLEIMVKIADMQKDINDSINELIELKMEVTEWMNTIEDNTIRTILYKKYFASKTWEQIAEEMDFTSRWVQELHKTFINSL